MCLMNGLLNGLLIDAICNSMRVDPMSRIVSRLQSFPRSSDSSLSTHSSVVCQPSDDAIYEPSICYWSCLLERLLSLGYHSAYTPPY